VVHAGHDKHIRDEVGAIDVEVYREAVGQLGAEHLRIGQRANEQCISATSPPPPAPNLPQRIQSKRL
jgi:hypothetical protein